MPKNSKIALFVLLALALLFSGCQSSQAVTPAANTKAKESRSVRLITAEQGKLPSTVTATGTLAADADVAVGFKVAGRVSEITVDLGSQVNKEQLLARLDPKDFELLVNQAEAGLRQARARLGLSPEGTDDRVDPEQTAQVKEARAVLEEARLARDRLAGLFVKSYIPKADFDLAESRLLVAESRYQASLEEIRDRQAVLAQKRSEIALARQQLADTVLLSPLTGAVQERKAAAGEFLAAGTPVVRLVRLHPLRLNVAVPEREVQAIRIGQQVRVKVEGEAVEQPGRIVRISPVLDTRNRTLVVEAEIDNPRHRLRPGSFARAEITVDTEQPALLVPSSAIVSFAGIEKVILEKDGKAVERRIRTGRRTGYRVEVLEGLKHGDQFIADPGNLSGGQSVTVTR